MKILAIGDIHLGKSFPVIPKTLTGNKDFWIESSLNNILTFAEQENVDLVLFTGDIIENENDRFEALPILSAFIKSLTKLNISTIAIAGNHDVNALPRIKKLLPDLYVLDNNGWESKIIENSKGCAVNIIGISHNQERKENPFNFFDDQLLENKLINIGLLHCTLGTAPAKYVPVKKDELSSSNIDLWLLGHIHKPDEFNEKTKYGYLGSISGLDISETGIHGIQLIEIENNYIKKNIRIPISSLRWENIEIDISELTETNPEEFKDQLVEKFHHVTKFKLETIKPELKYIKLIGFRVFLTGSLPLALNIETILSDFNNYHLDTYNSSIEIFIEKVINKTYLKLDIEKLSKQNDPAGLACQLLLNSEKQDNSQVIKDLEEFIKEKTTFKQRKYINEYITANNIESIIKERCRNNVIELWNQNK